MEIGDDIIDSRDIQERIDELESEYDELRTRLDHAENVDEAEEIEVDLELFRKDELKELEMLRQSAGTALAVALPRFVRLLRLFEMRQNQPTQPIRRGPLAITPLVSSAQRESGHIRPSYEIRLNQTD